MDKTLKKNLLKLLQDKEAVITLKRKEMSVEKFYRIGYSSDMDTFFLLESLPDSALKILISLLNRRSMENIFRVHNKKNDGIMTSALVRKFYRNVDALYDTDLVRSMQRGVYMINPYIFFPQYAKDVERCRELWDNLPKGSPKKSTEVL